MNALDVLRRYYALNDREYQDALRRVETAIEAARGVNEQYGPYSRLAAALRDLEEKA